MDFFEALGRPKKIVAPMVDQSDLAYRMLTRRYGADLCFTQMFNANSMVSSTDYCEENFQTTQGDRPLIVQIAGHDPQVMLQAAKLLEDHCDAIDINLGCPQGIAKRGRYGAFLMEELELLGNIVQTLSKNLKVPVTCKTRIYKGQGGFERSVRLCETLVGAGASMLTIHGRTREEKGQQVGASDWSTLKRLKEHFKDRGVPIIANGGIETLQDVHECLKVTGCDGVMSSEAILENPRMFDAAAVHTAESQLDIAMEYLTLCRKHPPRHFKSIRSHCMKFLFRYFEVHVDLRTEAALVDRIEDMERICEALREHVASGDPAAYEVSWYNRHKNLAEKHEAGSNKPLPRWDDETDWNGPGGEGSNGCCGAMGAASAGEAADATLFSGLSLFGDGSDEE